MKTNSTYRAADIIRWRDWARDEGAVRVACRTAMLRWHAANPVAGPVRPATAGRHRAGAASPRQARLLARRKAREQAT